MTRLPKWHGPTFSFLYSTLQIKNLTYYYQQMEYERVKQIALTALNSPAATNALRTLSYKALVDAYFLEANYIEAFPYLHALLAQEPDNGPALDMLTWLEGQEGPIGSSLE